MNRARLTLALILLVSACGGDDSSTDGGADGSDNDVTVKDSGKDSTATDASPTDSSTTDSSTTDSSTTDSSTTDASTTDSSTTDASDGGLPIGIGCATPSDCDAGFCCGTIVFNGGNIPNCNLADASTACQTTCNSNVQLSCTAVDTVRGCVAHADCADAGTGYTDCCNVPIAPDASAEFCWDSNYANLISGASCL